MGYTRKENFEIQEDPKCKDIAEIISILPVTDAVGVRQMEAREIAAVLYDLRPVAEIQIDIASNKAGDMLERLRGRLTTSGLFMAFTELASSDVDSNKEKSYEIYVSKDKVWAEDAIEVSKLYPSSDFHRRFGELMGFPQTAIDAYMAKDCLTGTEAINLGFPRNFEDGPAIIPFGISKKHYREEAEYLKKYFKVLIESFPDTWGAAIIGENLEKYKDEVKRFLEKDFGQ